MLSTCVERRPKLEVNGWKESFKHVGKIVDKTGEKIVKNKCKKKKKNMWKVVVDKCG